MRDGPFLREMMRWASDCADREERRIRDLEVKRHSPDWPTRWSARLALPFARMRKASFERQGRKAKMRLWGMVI